MTARPSTAPSKEGPLPFDETALKRLGPARYEIVGANGKTAKVYLDKVLPDGTTLADAVNDHLRLSILGSVHNQASQTKAHAR